MTRFRLRPTSEQEAVLLSHSAQARFVWNLCVEQESLWRPGRGKMPGFLERCRQLTDARAENAWLAAGPVTVQQQAIRDHDQAMCGFFNGTHGRPSWRKAGRNEGFRITGERGNHWDARRLSRHWGAVRVPKAGWVRFRWSRSIPEDVKSFRVTRDRAGRWHVAFAFIPDPITAPGNGTVVGIDRGIAVSAALSTGETLSLPGLTRGEQRRIRKLERKLASAVRGSDRSSKVKASLAKLKAREADRRKDWCEQLSTRLAREFDTIRVENLHISHMTRSAKGSASAPGRNVKAKAALNRGILRSGWGLLVRRLENKAYGRVERVNPAFTSQRCSACGLVDRESRESQALFRCTACNFTLNADVNAARNIAAGHAVTARGGFGTARPANREPQLLQLK
jgi:putative transposase